MCRRRSRGLLTNFAATLTLIPSPPPSPAHRRWSPAPLDFLHFFHPIGPGPLPHWIFSRPSGLPTNKVHTSILTHTHTPSPPPFNGSLIRPAFHACPLLYWFINFIPSPLFLSLTHNCAATTPKKFCCNQVIFFWSFSSLFFFTRDYTWW
jgi:hypothetical protein